MVCEINITSIVSGVAASLIAAFVFYCMQVCFENKKNKAKYQKLSGTYKGYRYTKEDSTIIDKTTSSSTAIVKYLGKTNLSIEVSHDKRCWRGNIIMHYENYGIITWIYDPHSPNEFNAGYKRCLVHENKQTGSLMLQLVAEPFLDGSYKEITDGNTNDLLKKILIPNREVFIKTDNSEN